MGLTKAHCRAVLASTKDSVTDDQVRWRPTATAAGVIYRYDMGPVPLHCHGLDAQTFIGGVSRQDGDVQLYLRQQEGRSEAEIARLCLTPSHGDAVHWHLFEHAKGKTETMPVSHPPETLSRAALLHEVFLPHLKVPCQTGLSP